jgi:hypothetical protein
VNHLFAGADADVDGVLSFEEILNNHELFVGSEVNQSINQYIPFAGSEGKSINTPHLNNRELFVGSEVIQSKQSSCGSEVNQSIQYL